MQRPANFFEIRIGAQFNLRAKYDRNVVPSGQSDNDPFSKSDTSSEANFSSSADHFPARWTKYISCSHGRIDELLSPVDSFSDGSDGGATTAAAVSIRLRLRVTRSLIG
jgi:hypothetical protein